MKDGESRDRGVIGGGGAASSGAEGGGSGGGGGAEGNLNLEAKYRGAAARWRGAAEASARVSAEHAASAESLDATLEAVERRAEALEMSFRARKLEVGVASESAVGKALGSAAAERRLRREDAEEAALSEARLRHIQLTRARAGLERRIKAKERLAEGLHLIDFEQLKMETQATRDKIEARDAEARKLKGKLSGVAQALTHAREKLQFVVAENAELTREMKTLDAQSRRKGDVMQRIKDELAAFRAENAKMEAEAATVSDPALLEDYAAQRRRTDRANRTRERVETALAEKMARLSTLTRTPKTEARTPGNEPTASGGGRRRGRKPGPRRRD